MSDLGHEISDIFWIVPVFFDRVHYYQLFNLLVKKNLCPMIIRLLLHLYLNPKICVKWGDAISQEVVVTCKFNR